MKRHVAASSRARKSLFDLARENAVEGCAKRTRHRNARDEGLREALAAIAPDELRHAQLSHHVAAWAEPKLNDHRRAQLRAERRAFAQELRAGADDVHPRELYAVAGYPPPVVALHMLDVLERELWA